MDILKSFSLCGSEYPINIQGTAENPLFQSNQIAKLLGMKCINKQIMNFDSSLKGITESNTLGGSQKMSFLTEKGLYRVICRSNKPIAEKFQNWICDVIKEIRLTGEYKLKEQLEKSEQHWEINKKLIIQQAKLDIHTKLLELYHLKNVVYICKLKDNENGKYVIKIGSTQNVKERINNIANNYGCIPLVLDIYECMNHTKFENWVRTNPSIKQLYFEIKKKNGAITRETFLVNDDEYNMIIKLIKNDIKSFHSTPYETPIEKLIELEEKKKINFDLEYKTEEKKLEVLCKLEEFTQTPAEETHTNDKIEETSSHIQRPIHFLKNRQHTRSPKVYQIEPETLAVINIFDSIIDVIRNFPGSSPSALKEAAKKNTIYKYYRWILADRTIANLSELIIQPTIKAISQNIEYIAMIDIQQTKIMDVYASQKDAALARNLAGYSTISRAIKQNSISSGHYWKLFNNCSDDMRSVYLSKNKLPEKFTKTSSISVSQIDPITNKEIMTYNTITDVLLKYQMSRITLKKCSDNNEIYKCYKWKIVKKEI